MGTLITLSKYKYKRRKGRAPRSRWILTVKQDNQPVQRHEFKAKRVARDVRRRLRWQYDAPIDSCIRPVGLPEGVFLMLDEAQMRQQLVLFVYERGGMQNAAAALGVSPGNLQQIFRKRQPVSTRIAARLGYARHHVYTPIQHRTIADDAPAEQRKGRECTKPPP